MNCVVCGVEFKQILGTARWATEGWGVCPTCQWLYDRGYVTFVGVDASKTAFNEDGVPKVDCTARTGRFVRLKFFAWRFIIDEAIPLQDSCPRVPVIMVFTEDSAIIHLAGKILQFGLDKADYILTEVKGSDD